MAYGNDTWGGNPLDDPNRNFFGGGAGSPGFGGGMGRRKPAPAGPGAGGEGGGGGNTIQTLPWTNEGSNNTDPGGGWSGWGGGQPEPTGGESNSMPWLNSWQGDFTSPMSPEERNSLDAYGRFAGEGMGGTAGAQDYYDRSLSGDYLDFDKNPWLKQIQDNGQILKNYEDSDALRRIQSSMSAGGNAMSGANTGAQMDYLGKSDAAFNSLMGNLFNQDYGMERGFQDSAARGSLAAGQQQGNAISNYFNMGSLPRNLQQHDLDSQYGDWLRQTNAARDAYQYPDYLTNAAMGHGYPGSGPANYGQSQSQGWTALLQQLFGGDGSGSTNYQSIIDAIGGLFGGGAGTGETPPADEGGGESVITGGTDAEPTGYDGAQSGPSSYQDAGWYKGALDSAHQNREKASHDPNGGATTAAGILALIMTLLGKNGLGQSLGANKKKKANQVGMGGGGPGGSGTKGQTPPGGGHVTPTPGNEMNGPNDPFGPYGQQGTDSYGLDENGLPPGASMDENGVGNIDWENYGYPGDYGQPDNQGLTDFLGNYPIDNSMDPGSDWSGGEDWGEGVVF